MEVLQAISKKHIVKNVKFNKFENSDSLSEIALGLVRKINTGTFRYNISMKEKLASKKRLLSEINSVFDSLGLVMSFLL